MSNQPDQPFPKQNNQQPYGQPPFGQPPQQAPYGQPPYGQPPQQYSQPPQQAPYGQPPYGQPPQQYSQPPQQAPYGQQYGHPPYGQQYGQPPYQSQQMPNAPKKRRRWPWILAIIAGILVLACAGGAFLVYGAVHNSPAKTTAQQYYTAIQSQDYTNAYSHVDPSIKLTYLGQTQQVNQQLFTQVAQGYDQAKGKVTSFNITGVNISSSTSAGNTGNVTVNVTRNNKAYDVHLQMQQVGNDWKIVAFDNL